MSDLGIMSTIYTNFHRTPDLRESLKNEVHLRSLFILPLIPTFFPYLSLCSSINMSWAFPIVVHLAVDFVEVDGCGPMTAVAFCLSF